MNHALPAFAFEIQLCFPFVQLVAANTQPYGNISGRSIRCLHAAHRFGFELFDLDLAGTAFPCHWYISMATLSPIESVR
jgi:hypothetical protein